MRALFLFFVVFSLSVSPVTDERSGGDGGKSQRFQWNYAEKVRCDGLFLLHDIYCAIVFLLHIVLVILQFSLVKSHVLTTRCIFPNKTNIV
jgi:hypothetical protein